MLPTRRAPVAAAALRLGGALIGVAHVGVALLGVGCVDPIDEVPIVAQSWCAEQRVERVACVLDGDTFDFGTCTGNEDDKVRMLGVDAPEISHNSTEVADCYGDESAEFMTEIVNGRDVELQFDVECTDIYGRNLAWVMLKGDQGDPLYETLVSLNGLGIQTDGTFEVLANELSVRLGYSTVFEGDIAENVRYATRMDEAMALAEAELRGLWSPETCDGP
jgi:endonuclease YncB( thermonuclease family)